MRGASSAILVLLLGVIQGGYAIKLDEWLGLRMPKDARELQGGTFALCATAFNGGKGHLLTNLNKKGKPLEQWIPAPNQNFAAIVNLNAGTFTLSGQVVPKGDKNLDNALTIDIIYSNPVSFDKCYCASEDFLGDITNINYNKIEKKCNLDNFLNRPDSDKDLHFCPFCESRQCQKAAKNSAAPNPVYQDWLFFSEVSGSLSGPGIDLFYSLIQKGFKGSGINQDFSVCTPDFTNLPLGQLECSSYDDPESGSGFGVNGKNQNCGFSAWFNCREILPNLGGDAVDVHLADINLDLITCPTAPLSPEPTPAVIIPPTLSPSKGPTTAPSVTPSVTPTVHPTPAPSTPLPTLLPTVPPTSFPTAKPSTAPTPGPTVSPTVAPTACPKPKPCKKIEVCVPCDQFPEGTDCSDHEIFIH